VNISSITVDKNAYETPILQDVNGLIIRLRIPPSFIPDRVEGKYLPDTDSFEISFIYKDNEKGEIVYEDSNILFIVGKHTKKMIKILAKNIQLKKVALIQLEQIIKKEVETSFDKAIDRVSKIIEKKNLEVTKLLVSGSINELVGKASSN
jgi:hypothetical protein